MELFEKVNEELETKFKNDSELNWLYISKDRILSERFIEKYKDKLDWWCISQYQILSESFIEKFKDKVDWKCISMHQKLSEEFIEKYINKLNWTYISAYQILSEQFIDKWKDKVDWDYISAYQKLSEEFIEKHKDKIDFGYLEKNILVQSDIEKDWFIAYISRENINKFNNYVFGTLDQVLEVYEPKDVIKVKIFYKDLINNNTTLKISIIRENMSRYKICRKNEII